MLTETLLPGSESPDSLKTEAFSSRKAGFLMAEGLKQQPEWSWPWALLRQMDRGAYTHPGLEHQLHMTISSSTGEGSGPTI